MTWPQVLTDSRHLPGVEPGWQPEPSEPSRGLPTRNSHLGPGRAGALLLALLLVPVAAHSQRNGGFHFVPQHVREPGRQDGTPVQAPRGQPEGFFRRLRDLPPAEQKHALANDPQFRNLSPERQALIREHLRQWNAMSSQQRDRIREREEILGALSPAQRQAARNLAPQWRDLSGPRRQAVMVAFRHLRDLPPDQRRAYLDSQEVREQFSSREREILEGMNKLIADAR